MTPDEYQKLAARTICPQLPVLQRIGVDTGSYHPQRLEEMEKHLRLIHATVGGAGEAGELATQIQRAFWYGKGLDRQNVIEELGDQLWYVCEACTALGVNLSDVMAGNIRKLAKRYPEKYTDELAAEENRNRKAEMIAMNGQPASRGAIPPRLDTSMLVTESGFAEPPEEECDHEDPDRSGFCIKCQATWEEMYPREPKRVGYDTVEEYKAANPGMVVSNSYDRMCSKCRVRPIHKSNEAGICADCR